MTKPQIDPNLMSKIHAICASETDHITLMALIACELFRAVEGFDWAGLYRVEAPGVLKLGPYQGGHGCLMIRYDKGICGAAARNQQTQIVNDVRQFDGHIACIASTQSELVIPVFDEGQNLLAVLDLDSNQPAFFSQQLFMQLETLLAKLFGPIEAAG